ncbi:phosphotransferase family protein [Maricurvus nonylphenolicus]|uniref:phosphotransferase family protein n=1 Tax=Maricurvus nonylphenolicus TaxID=1008307 RepID=UPI0036F3857A
MNSSITQQIEIEKNKGALAEPGTEVLQDWDRLATHLDDHGLRLDLEITPMQFASGFGNLNYLIKIDHALAVLRRPPMGPIPPGANDMAREYFILSRLSDAYPLAPRALHFCESTDVLGAHFLIMQYRPGLIIGSHIPQTVFERWQGEEPIGQRLGEQLINALAGLHRVTPAEVGLDKLGKPEGFIERTLKGWKKRAELAWQDSVPTSLLNVIEWLEVNKPDSATSSFIHNDFKLDNMILDPDSLQPVAVIDWDMGTQGAPLYDLAVLLSYWTETADPQCMHDLAQMPTSRHGFFGRQQAAEYYASLTGERMEDIKYFRVLASLRIAVVFRQLYRRYQEGGTQDERYATFDALSAQLAEFAQAVVENKYF